MNTKSSIQAMIEESDREQARPPLFLDAWKDAVLLVGTQYFSVTCDYVATATDIDQLRPDVRMIFNALGPMSSHERTFMLCLCQLFCDNDTRSLCTDSQIPMPSLADMACMDDKHRDVVVRLLANYTGW